ncbi:unnamed protein product [Symbiodinium sp. CCMP2592]|nr:unnamed protein product [Symbiodinium sp. CCMP2592]
MPPKKGKKAEAAAAKKARLEDKEKVQVREAIALQQRQGQAQILSELMGYFESHPSEASFMLANIKAGHMDFNNEPEPSETKLPGHMNKVKLLSKEVSLGILSELNSGLSEWLSTTTVQPAPEDGGRQKSLSRLDVASVLGYLCGMDPASALPCKSLGRLTRKLKERYELLGARGSTFRVSEQKTLKDWSGTSCVKLGTQDFWAEHSYWSLEKIADGQFNLVDNTLVTSAARAKTKVKLPAELCAGGDPVLADPFLWAKCTIKRGVCVRAVGQLLEEMKIQDRFAVSRPLVLKECDGGPETPTKKKITTPNEASEKSQQPGPTANKTPQSRKRKRLQTSESPGSPKTPRRRLFSPGSNGAGPGPKAKSRPSTPKSSNKGETDEADEELPELEGNEGEPPENGDGTFQM